MSIKRIFLLLVATISLIVAATGNYINSVKREELRAQFMVLEEETGRVTLFRSSGGTHSYIDSDKNRHSTSSSTSNEIIDEFIAIGESNARLIEGLFIMLLLVVLGLYINEEVYEIAFVVFLELGRYLLDKAFLCVISVFMLAQGLDGVLMGKRRNRRHRRSRAAHI